MNTEHLFRTAESLENSLSHIPFSEIPDIDLYMDQITTFFDENLSGLKRTEKDKILTKTMINNYTKDKILPRSRNKKYSKEHMALLILIYHLKFTMSIPDVKRIIQTIANLDVNLEEVYESFQDLLSSQYEGLLRNSIEKIGQSGIGEICKNEKEIALMVAMSLIVTANANKRMAEKIIDEILLD